MDYRTEAPEIIKGFLIYHETIKGHSKKTVEEYYLDLRTFFRYMKIIRGIVPRNTELDEISISDIDIDFVKSVTVTEVYEYLSFLSRDRVKNQRSRDTEYGTKASTRARKVSTLRSFYKYLSTKAKLIDVNPLQDLDVPKIPNTLPRYLTLQEAQALLSSVDGKNKERDYCILCIFLNCGLRISEIAGMNLSDIRSDHIRVLGKGNKERHVPISPYLQKVMLKYERMRDYYFDDKNIKFDNYLLSRTGQPLTKEALEHIFNQANQKAHIRDTIRCSPHTARHYFAQACLRNGLDLYSVSRLLGHENINITKRYLQSLEDKSIVDMASKASPLLNLRI